MYQPGLEAELAERGAELPGVTVHRGRTAVDLTEHEDRVDVVTEDADGGRHTYSARWVIGCDGANSFVGGRIDPAVTDYSFAHDWLICDVVTHDKREYKPNNLQICDPARPRTAVSAGPGHRRWEFMRVPGETVEELGHIDNVWKLLGLFGLDPDNATLERHAVYTTQARCADQWRSGGSSSRATPHTSCRPSSGRACARASATPSTSPGSCTWYSAASPTNSSSTPTPSNAAPMYGRPSRRPSPWAR